MKVYAFGAREDEIIRFGEQAKDAGHEVTVEPISFNPEFWEKVKGYDAISTVGNCQVDADAVAHLAKEGIRFIAQRAAGTNNIDLAACKEHGIKVSNVPAYSPTSVSEYTVGAALNMTRNFAKALERSQRQNWAVEGTLLGQEMHRMTIGVVGTGRIGFSVIRAFSGLTKNILAYDVYQNPEVENYAKYVDLDTLLKESDLITLHCPLFDDNYHMIDKDAIAKMKDGVYLINAARGALVDAEALIEGIISGKIKAATLDTYEKEGGVFFVDHTDECLEDPTLARLLQLPNVYVTPHYAFYTDVAVDNIIADVLTSLSQFDRGEDCTHLVV